MIKILIVDDEEDLAGLLKINLEVEGFECDVAHNGQVGLERAEVFSPDVILLDIRMPVLDGYQTLEKLKNNEKTQDIHVIMCTTVKGDENIKRAYNLGASGYIVKPFESNEIIEKIKEVCNL